ncbi:hypothetical protein KR032_006505 [Drosophila birchii]|nr:hypothetical protein KR032_006505 [Drosophila birchii]
MESAAKLDKNSAAMPQRQQKGNQVNINVGKLKASKVNESSDGSSSKKKARFSQNAKNGGVTGGGAPRSQNQKKNFANKSGVAGMNLSRSRGGQISSGPGGMNNSVMGEGGGPGGSGGGRGGEDFFIGQRLRSIAGPTLELPPVELPAEIKFSGRNRLYVGNLTSDITDDELREIFKPYGEIGEITHLDKNFTFLKVDYHLNAEKAKRGLDGSMLKGRQLRVRFAPNATILRVSNLNQYVTNELLYKSFEIFGPIERAIITVDGFGRHTGEGVVEFAKKSSASACLRLCNEKCFFLTASLRPCLVEPMDVNDDNDGLPEKAINNSSLEFFQERSIGPRFAHHSSFEHEYGSRWKCLHKLYKIKQDALKRELEMEEDRLEYVRCEQETELLRQELRKREVENQRKKWEWEMRVKEVEDMRKPQNETMRMPNHMIRQEDMRRWQQENTLLMQAQQLNC